MYACVCVCMYACIKKKNDCFDKEKEKEKSNDLHSWLRRKKEKKTK